ncbi:phage tail protein [Yersinia enterocolitica]|uniref:phage tail-collar fiber domain-containing protein n=1 Tax=Yersinia enterocolitica TaxID=630 RepID=UPI0005DAF636|nr:phage tail protein [Yersinia enterocolitica]EKN4828926.1 phage tail protein [Yersinia enterocolitica]ELW8174853.1 phage tail protein [Yersinia enterocolitica]UYJ78301.1 phage tail protein [Yersinia enterocolitica]CNE88386.1 tail fiber repeat 2-containing protein [Yersinia enterocolitica]CQH58289.1 tail fiber repeat 2-containing protein [Yersinia enterocolitica]
MATVITRAFEHWQAGQVLNNLPARPDTIIFAHVPGLDHTADINPDEGIPADGQIVHRDVVAQYGMINDSAVAYSVVLDTRVGDFTFNWIGLVDAASNTLCMIVHTPAQQKIATANGVQGNNITRTFLMEFAGAAEASQITVSAQTWQIDFSARLRGIDEVSRLANLDYYGHAAFFSDGFSVSKDGDKYRVKAGLAYVGGIRALLADDVLLEAAAGNVVYADVSYQGSVLSEFTPIIQLGVKHSAGDFGDYTDANGFTHYIASLALITASGEEDKREANPFDKAIADINAALKEHEKSRNHPDATLNDKGFTQLSSAVDSDSETLAATSKAAKIAMDNANARLAKERNGADIPNVALFRQNIGVKGAASLEVGTTAGTVAAGDDSRIVNAISSQSTHVQLPGALTAGSDIRAGRLLSKGDLIAGEGRAEGHAALAVDGNVHGTAWGGALSSHLANRFNDYGVYALGRGAQVAMGSSLYNMMSPAGTFLTGVTVNGNGQTQVVYYRGLFMQRPAGGWVQMGGDIG